MVGGYQILNLSRWNLTSTSTKIKGAYSFIENNTEHKTVLLEDLMLEGKRYDAIFTTFAKAADNYVGNFVLNDMIYTIIVRSNDNINIRKLEMVSDIDLKNIVSDEWNASTDYTAGAYVLRSNKLYVALLQSNGKDPLTETEYWEQKKLTEVVGSETTETFNITPTSSVYRSDFFQIIKHGKVAEMYLYNVGVYTNQDVVIGHTDVLPTAYQVIAIGACMGSQLTTDAVVAIKQNGDIVCAKSSGLLYLTLTYICE